MVTGKQQEPQHLCNVATVAAYIGLGSNEGDRLDHLRAACRHLSAAEGIVIEAYSRVYETQSIEGGGPTDFLNAAVRVRTARATVELLNLLLEIEGRLGRPAPPRAGSRAIDLDLLLYGDERIEMPRLTVPHPRLLRRAFVLRPLSDVLEGGWVRETSLSLDPDL